MVPKKIKSPVFLFDGSILKIFILLDFLTNHFSEKAKSFPKFVLGIGIITLTFWRITYVVFRTLLKFIEAQTEKEEWAVNRLHYYRSWLCIAGSILMGYLFGFIFAVPTAILSYGLMLGERKKFVSFITLLSTHLHAGGILFQVESSMGAMDG